MRPRVLRARRPGLQVQPQAPRRAPEPGAQVEVPERPAEGALAQVVRAHLAVRALAQAPAPVVAALAAAAAALVAARAPVAAPRLAPA